MITLIIFSKDRAMQLDSLLRSVREHCTGIDDVAVIARASSELHIESYRAIRDTDLYDAFVCDGPGNDTPIGQHLDIALLDYSHVALAVDDQIFYAPSDFAWAAKELDTEKAFAWSWRLGQGNNAAGDTCDGSFWRCSALTDDHDYGYLFHSDGALYKTFDYEVMLGHYLPDWRTGQYTPNDLEAAVAARKSDWAAKTGPHLGPLKSTCITWQLNRVQTKYGSPAAEIPGTNVDALAAAYIAGKRVNNDILYAMLQADPLCWNPPGARPTHVYASEQASKVWASCIR